MSLDWGKHDCCFGDPGFGPAEKNQVEASNATSAFSGPLQYLLEGSVGLGSQRLYGMGAS